MKPVAPVTNTRMVRSLEKGDVRPWPAGTPAVPDRRLHCARTAGRTSKARSESVNAFQASPQARRALCLFPACNWRYAERMTDSASPVDLDLRLVRYFTVVAGHRHFGRAAAELRVAQPSLSRQIRRLEQQLGARLLDRTPQGTS